jgi:acetyl-CoA C-acetyltransferase
VNDDRVPVVVASGQAVERDEPVTALDLAARAGEAALALVPRLRPSIGRVSAVGTLSPTGPRFASALAGRLALTGARACEVGAIGGNTPQAFVTRAAADVAAGRVDAVLVAGAESVRSVRAGHRVVDADTEGERDTVVGDDRLGVGPAETAIGLLLPVHLYAMFESAIAAAAGRSGAEHRAALGELLAPFAAVAAGHPFAWFTDAPAAEDIATPGPANRLVAEPYTKRMAAFLDVDQGAAVVVCSLAAARAAGVADRAVFVWSGASCNDVWEPVARPDLTASPGIAAAAGAALAAAGIGVDDVGRFDLYSCFPAAVQAAAAAIGLRTDDARGLTLTGGLPYFGGPGNDYSTHAIATMTDLLRDDGAGTGLVGALGWYTTKHAYGLYGAGPPPRGFAVGDTATDQARIDATALPVAVDLDEPAVGTVVAATIVHGGEGIAAAPAFVTLDDARRVAASAGTGPASVGDRVRVAGAPPTYEVIT